MKVAMIPGTMAEQVFLVLLHMVLGKQIWRLAAGKARVYFLGPFRAYLSWRLLILDLHLAVVYGNNMEKLKTLVFGTSTTCSTASRTRQRAA